MKLVQFLKAMPEHSANIGEEMAFDDALATTLVAKGRAEFIMVAPTVVKLEAEPEIVDEVGLLSPTAEPVSEEISIRATAESKSELAGDDPASIAGPPLGDPVPERRGPGRPRKHF